jgi:hypothetical protein
VLRRCFLPPVREFDMAADLLSQTADALLRHDLTQAAELLRASDLRPPKLSVFAYSVAGPINPTIHRQTKTRYSSIGTGKARECHP